MVTGSRRWRDIDAIKVALWSVIQPDASPEDVTVIQGCATGADAIARSIALDIGCEVEDFWPDYANFGFAEANMIRNMAMVDSAPTAVLAFPLPGSRRTWHAVKYAEAKDIHVMLRGLGYE